MEKPACHVWRYGAPLLVLAAGAAALWPFRHQLTAEAIAAFSPRQTVLASSFLVGLYALKSLSVCFPMSALTAAGGLLFPFPLALAVNLCGTGVAQTIPFFLGRREQGGLEALAERIPRVAGVCRAQAENPWLSVFLLRLAGASPGDVVSLYLRHVSLRRAAGRPAPDCLRHRAGRRAVAAGERALLAVPGGGRGADGPLRRYLAPVAAPQEGVKRRLLFSAKPCTLLSASSICPMREMVGCRR